MMNGKITSFFTDKGFGFIKDENNENRYFHITKVNNPELVKKDAPVTFEPSTNNKGPAAHNVKVIPASKYITVANQRIKITSIKSFHTHSKEVENQVKIDKINTVFSVGLLMNKIKPINPEEHNQPRILNLLSITNFHNITYTFSEDEIDIEYTLEILRNLKK